MLSDPKVRPYEVHDTLEMDTAELKELIRRSAEDARPELQELPSQFDLGSDELDD